jgi:hypothetical protein
MFIDKTELYQILEGDFPKYALKAALKYFTLENPHNSLTSVTV